MHILVTGGTGLIGSSLIKFLNNHHKVTVLSRSQAKVYHINGHQVNAIKNLNEVDFNQVNIIINLAGEPIANKRWSVKQKHLIEQSRWHLTQELVDCINAAQTPPHTFISGSAIGYYGRQDPQPIDENYTNCYPEFSHKLCKQWEEIALQAHSDTTRVCILRTGIVLAKKAGALKKMLPAYKCALGGPISDGDQMMSWIHIDDMVSLIIFLIEKRELQGVFNATSPNPVTNEEFSRMLAGTLKRPNFAKMPAKIVKLLFGEMAELLIYGQNVQPVKLQQAGFRFHYPKIKGALNQLLRQHPE